ncbi:dTDP-4-dehydrorhamnose reductase family protein [Paraburkholderia saeva]|uniref:dTDP-4-dehydrorhamnose reductase n=1 Tax=Paraburkholderia saeva TaxID=2777537 RepID=A0A9N8X1Z4_9BURK|nr:SDR family oxidoreductase [Paraburkholderia saeva]CAG4900172.1 dTDP-4-dehydrorhamnose reductase [Paraburkholderia saeva]CAG4924203.1 dTDP-4-dehydrorhamnose reductase [Paraburkholderia saeva]CAG4925168.1 dTDP-4-dehydrorhamnose reductase [Paraburkholderia saeva]
MFKVAVIGASGLLGRAIAGELAQQRGWQIVSTAFRRADPHMTALDVRDAQAVDAFVAREKPDALVVAAAERRPDICENDPALARALNVDAVRTLASAANRHGAWVLSISTDYVFDGSRPPYRHDDPPAPINAYGRSKLDGERVLLETAQRGCVLRLPLLYGPIVDWRESAVTSLVPAIAASAPDAAGASGTMPATMDAWAIRYPTFTPDVAFVIRQMLECHVRGETVNGIVQWSGDEPMTKYDIARHLAGALRLDAQLAPQHMPTDATPRPHNCHLDASRLETLGIGRRTPFDEAIRQVLTMFPWSDEGHAAA